MKTFIIVCSITLGYIIVCLVVWAIVRVGTRNDEYEEGDLNDEDRAKVLEKFGNEFFKNIPGCNDIPSRQSLDYNNKGKE